MNESRFQTILIAITLSSALFYFEGLVYHQAYLSGFGIESSLSAFSVEQIMSYGFIAIAGLSAIPIVFLAALIAPISLLIVYILVSVKPELVHFLKRVSTNIKPRLHSEKYKEILKKVSERLKGSRLVILHEKAMDWIAYPFFLLIFILLITVAVSEQGNKQADKEKKSFSTNKNLSSVSTSTNPTPTKAMLITCNESFCSFWLGDESLTIRIENIQQMSVVPPQKK